jgi:hypothetical protein
VRRIGRGIGLHKVAAQDRGERDREHAGAWRLTPTRPRGTLAGPPTALVERPVKPCCLALQKCVFADAVRAR